MSTENQYRKNNVKMKNDNDNDQNFFNFAVSLNKESYSTIGLKHPVNTFITLSVSCAALGGAVVGCESKFELTSEIL